MTIHGYKVNVTVTVTRRFAAVSCNRHIFRRGARTSIYRVRSYVGVF
jgi:hypothetical protein